jgi:phosphopantothenoylcysteine decarboxylase/phosphopantothenate--cysteine ligase
MLSFAIPRRMVTHRHVASGTRAVSQPKSILLIIGGGVAAYKALLLIRLLKARGVEGRAVLTAGGSQFVTPLSVGALSGEKVFTDLFDLTDEAEMGHIQLSRAADLVVVVPATADLMAKMAGGHADDLATTLLLATDKDVLIAPAMNVRMWDHAATQANLATLRVRGVSVVGPNEGDMACGEYGPGRMAEPEEIFEAIMGRLESGPRDLAGKRIVVTSGPTHEPIDPVRYIANRSSGKQGNAIAAALAARGAEVVLVSGPVRLDPPGGVTMRSVESAREMLATTMEALPADAVVCAAAVADYRVAETADQKLKKTEGDDGRTLTLVENPDILATVSKLPPGERPALVVGFAAETQDVIAYASAKRDRKGCDWIVANDVSQGVFGGDENRVTVIDDTGAEDWPRMGKDAVAARLAERMAKALAK